MSLGARHSSGFQNTATQATSDFAQQLQANRQALQRQAIADLLGASHQLLGERPYSQYLLPKPDKSVLGGFGGALGAALGGAGGFALGGPGGALKGAQLGFGVGSSF